MFFCTLYIIIYWFFSLIWRAEMARGSYNYFFSHTRQFNPPNDILFNHMLWCPLTALKGHGWYTNICFGAEEVIPFFMLWQSLHPPLLNSCVAFGCLYSLHLCSLHKVDRWIDYMHVHSTGLHWNPQKITMTVYSTINCFQQKSQLSWTLLEDSAISEGWIWHPTQLF